MTCHVHLYVNHVITMNQTSDTPDHDLTVDLSVSDFNKLIELAESMRDACRQLSLALDMAIRKYDTTGSSLNRSAIRRQLMHESYKEMLREDDK